MQIVSPLVGAVDALFDVVPALDRCRPSACPECGCVAHPPDGRTGIVGHGTYERWVWGLCEAWGSHRRRLRVRRFFCRGCGQTISVLPEWLHPRRWYGAWVILEALLLYLVLGWSHSEVEWRYRGVVGERGWQSLTRWREELLTGLWGKWGRRLGVRDRARSTDEGRRRLQRLLAQVGEGSCLQGSGERAAPRLLGGTTHRPGSERG